MAQYALFPEAQQASLAQSYSVVLLRYDCYTDSTQKSTQVLTGVREPDGFSADQLAELTAINAVLFEDSFALRQYLNPLLLAENPPPVPSGLKAIAQRVMNFITGAKS